MKKFLAISWAFPPVILPRALQVSRTLKSLRENGWQASIVAVDPRSIARAFKSDPALGLEYQGLFDLFHVPSPEDSLPVRAAWRLFPDLSLLPDPRSVWIPFAIARARRILKRGGFDGILSFAQPWSDHLIARKLSLEFGLPWIAHFSDPWTDSPYYHPRGLPASLRKKMEFNVIRDAGAVIFVSEETRDLVMRKYPAEWAGKAFVIPHCYEPLPIESIPAGVRTDASAPLRLVYTGGFYGHRTPLNLFEAILRLDREIGLEGKLEILLAGSGVESFQTRVDEPGLRKIVSLSPVVPYQESLRLAAQADVLLVIDAPSQDVNVFLPSKLIEYLAFRKPILGLTPLKGASADLLRELECPLVDAGDVDGIAATLRDLIRQKQAGGLKISPRFEATAARYDIRSTTRQFLDLMETFFK